VTDGPFSVAFADLDADGDLDLVSANAFGSNMTVFFQTSPGTFASTPLALGGFGVTSGAISVVAADLDGDGDLDLASANESGRGNDLTVFFQTSPGSFAVPIALGGPGLTDRASSVTAADLDEDGDLDLVSANASRSNMTVFFQTSPGSYDGVPLSLGGFGVTSGAFSVAAADLDGDGDLDLVSANPSGNNLTAFFQTSPGSFDAAPLVLGGPSVTVRPIFVCAANLDGDGDLDLVSANSNDLTVFFNTSGSFGAPLVLGGPGVTDRPSSVASADLDGDGDLDLVSANAVSDNLTVFFQTSPGSFCSGPLPDNGLGVTSSPRSVAAADLDGDGDFDFASANSVGDNLKVFFGGH
jgi:hypothetical protein